MRTREQLKEEQDKRYAVLESYFASKLLLPEIVKTRKPYAFEVEEDFWARYWVRTMDESIRDDANGLAYIEREKHAGWIIYRLTEPVHV